MKAIWTLLFLCMIGCTIGIALLFVPESRRTESFWLSVGAVGAAHFFLWVAFTFRGSARGGQPRELGKLSIMAASVLYFVAVAALGMVAIYSTISFKMLLALHIVALLGFVVFASLAAIGARVLQNTPEAQRPN